MKNFTLHCKGKLLHADKPLVMGILNLTTDSFYDGGKYFQEKAVLLRVEQMLQQGADIIDIGGMSTRQNAEIIDEVEELDRVIEPIRKIRAHFPEAILSIDTFRSRVADEAIRHGVSIVNDISGGTEDEAIFAVAAKYGCPYILMHRKGNMETMHKDTFYDDLLEDMLVYFTRQITKATEAGIQDVIIDVGFGFSKTIQQNYSILKHLSVFQQLDKPILAGLSRKSMLYKLLNTTPDHALNATSIVNTIALQNGAGILRVHDVKEAVECVKIYKQVTD